METAAIISEIERLPLAKKFYVVEETLKAIKKEEFHNQMLFAAEALYDEYANNEDLTAFTSLDLEDFYETR